MIKKCIGCGTVFQTDDANKEGYVEKENYEIVKLCQRCFRIKNYGDYKIVDKDIKYYEEILNNIKEKKDLVLFLCDILTLDDTLNKINDFNGKAILVITKKDLLPKSVKEEKILSYIKNNYKLNVLDIIFVSSNKNYNLDRLMNLIYKFKTSNNVYLVGNSNAGKSTLLNAIIKSYSNYESSITTSFIPETTLDLIDIKLNNDLNLIDTPGLINKDNYLFAEKPKLIKKITCKKEIKPRTYQIKPNESIIIGDYVRIDYLSEHKNSFTIYLSNDIIVKRIKLNTNDYLRNLNKISLDLDKNKDIVINGLCFCKIVDLAKVDIYVKKNVNVFQRDNLI